MDEPAVVTRHVFPQGVERQVAGRPLGRLLTLQVLDEAGQRTGRPDVRGCTKTCRRTGHCTTRRISPNTSPRTARSGPRSTTARRPVGSGTLTRCAAPPRSDGTGTRSAVRRRPPVPSAAAASGDVTCCAPASSRSPARRRRTGCGAGRGPPRPTTGPAPSHAAATSSTASAAAMPVHSRQPVSRAEHRRHGGDHDGHPAAGGHRPPAGPGVRGRGEVGRFSIVPSRRLRGPAPTTGPGRPDDPDDPVGSGSTGFAAIRRCSAAGAPRAARRPPPRRPSAR